MNLEQFDNIIDEVEQVREWSYIEHESRTHVRFDNGNKSLWLSFSEEYGISAEGSEAMVPDVNEILVINKVQIY